MNKYFAAGVLWLVVALLAGCDGGKASATDKKIAALEAEIKALRAELAADRAVNDKRFTNTFDLTVGNIQQIGALASNMLVVTRTVRGSMEYLKPLQNLCDESGEFPTSLSKRVYDLAGGNEIRNPFTPVRALAIDPETGLVMRPELYAAKYGHMKSTWPINKPLQFPTNGTN